MKKYKNSKEVKLPSFYYDKITKLWNDNMECDADVLAFYMGLLASLETCVRIIVEEQEVELPNFIKNEVAKFRSIMEKHVKNLHQTIRTEKAEKDENVTYH